MDLTTAMDVALVEAASAVEHDDVPIGAVLLDSNDPSKVIGRLEGPLISPSYEESSGYVPNVVYSCGALVHRDMLVIPYGISDRTTGFAIVSLEELLNKLQK